MGALTGRHIWERRLQRTLPRGDRNGRTGRGNASFHTNISQVQTGKRLLRMMKPLPIRTPETSHCAGITADGLQPGVQAEFLWRQCVRTSKGRVYRETGFAITGGRVRREV